MGNPHRFTQTALSPWVTCRWYSTHGMHHVGDQTDDPVLSPSCCWPQHPSLSRPVLFNFCHPLRRPVFLARHHVSPPFFPKKNIEYIYIYILMVTTQTQSYPHKEFSVLRFENLPAPEEVNGIPPTFSKVNHDGSRRPFNTILPPSYIRKTRNQGFWLLEVHVLRLLIRFVRRDDFGSCLRVWVCFFNDSHRSTWHTFLYVSFP
jgi:hypothetical protein